MTHQGQVLLRFRLRTEVDEETIRIIDHLIWCMRCLELWSVGTKNIWLHKLASAYFRNLSLEPFEDAESLIKQLSVHIKYLAEKRDNAQTYKPNVTLH